MPAITPNEPNRDLAEHARSEAFRSRDGKWVFELSYDAWSHLQLIDAHGKIYPDLVVLPLFPVATPRMDFDRQFRRGGTCLSSRCFRSFAGQSREDRAGIGLPRIRSANP
jgi:hypothetical protein